MKNNNFTKDWWFKFIEKNISFSETQVYKNVFSEELTTTLTNGVHEMLQSRINRFDIDSGFRLYLEGKEVSDENVRKIIEKNPLKDDVSIEQYCKRNFGNNFGIITNYGEKHSDILAEHILKTIRPLFDIIGIPPWGIELTTFIGNYGWTPLGIHTDNRGENVLHYHLGPGRKTMYVWDEDIYEKEGKGISNNKNIEPLLPFAKTYEFGTGDLYYMPWNKHHVGYTGDFSIGVTLWFNNPTRYDFSKLMIETIKNLYLKNDQSIIESQLDYVNNDNTLSDFLATLNIDSKMMDSPLRDFLTQTYKEYKKCLHSNGGWQNMPLSHHKKLDDTIDYYPNLENESIVSNSISPINVEKVDERIYLYVRGTRLSFKYFPELIKIIETINTGEQIQVSSLIQSNPNFPKEVILYFLKTLMNNKGIKSMSSNLIKQ